LAGLDIPNIRILHLRKNVVTALWCRLSRLMKLFPAMSSWPTWTFDKIWSRSSSRSWRQRIYQISRK
jgi:hypothetical protein